MPAIAGMAMQARTNARSNLFISASHDCNEKLLLLTFPLHNRTNYDHRLQFPALTARCLLCLGESTDGHRFQCRRFLIGCSLFVPHTHCGLMKPLTTIAEAREAGSTHVEVICSRCNRSTAHLLDILERQGCRTLDAARRLFICKRCGSRPNEVYFLKPRSDLVYFEYVVLLWDEQRHEIEQTLVAAQSLDEAGPAYESCCRRYPKRWVTLQGRAALLRDSDRREFVFDG